MLIQLVFILNKYFNEVTFMTPTGQWAKENGFTEVSVKYVDREEVEVVSCNCFQKG